MTVPTNSEIINAYIKHKSRKGWEVGHVYDDGAQFAMRKQWKKHGLWLGLVFLPFWGIGLIFWVFTILDYLMANDKIIAVSVIDMETELRARRV